MPLCDTWVQSCQIDISTGSSSVLKWIEELTFLFLSIDHLPIPSRCGKGALRRVSEVFDCWFESGSMPYAQVHYPFESKREFEDAFPADFIAEGIDQTRGWYVLSFFGYFCWFYFTKMCFLSVHMCLPSGDVVMRQAVLPCLPSMDTNMSFK